MADGSIAVYSAQKLAHGAGDKALLHRETTKHRTPVSLGCSLVPQKPLSFELKIELRGAVTARR